MKRADVAVAVGLGVAFVALLLVTTPAQGYARDEGFYFTAAESYARWLSLLATHPSQALTRAAIDAAWGVNHEHPPFAKLLFALSYLLHDKLHVFRDVGTSFRFPGMLFGGAAVTLTCAWATELRGRVAGIAAGIGFGFVPTTFYHAHLDCFDVPIAAMILATSFVYARQARRGGVGLALLCGIVYGLTLATKHNAWLLPPALVAHAVFVRRRALRRGDFRLPLALPAMLVLGPIVAIALWPWAWFDTAQRLRDYAQFHLRHEYYNIAFLGVTYFRPPFPHSYAPIMTLATVPTVALAAAVVGAFRALRERDEAFVLVALGVAVAYAPWLSSGTPIFGGTKHWLPAYPFLAIFAGAGVAWAARTLAPVHRALAPIVTVPVMLAAPIIESLHAAPWGLGGYVPLVGGAPGAASLGLNRSFWGYTTGSVLDVLDERTPPNGRVYVHDTALASFRMLQHDGKLRADIRPTGSIAQADVALFHEEPHMAGVEYQIWVAFGTTAPIVVRGLDGVPTVWVYARPEPVAPDGLTDPAPAGAPRSRRGISPR